MMRVLSCAVVLSTESSPAAASVSVIEEVRLIVLLAEPLLSAAASALRSWLSLSTLNVLQRDPRFKRLKRRAAGRGAGDPGFHLEVDEECVASIVTS